jgi:flagellar basal-body rod protein FlgG
MRALHTAATGMMAQELNVQVISNNIANLRTTGYKKQRAEFQDLLYENVRRVGTQSSDQGNVLPVGVEIGSGVKTVGTPRVMSQGSMLPTSKDLDVAIRGEGFFKILMPDGRFAYTRDGSFEMDNQGRIVTAQGYLVQPAITVPQNSTGLTINSQGQVAVTPAGTTTPTVLGQLETSLFINKTGLSSIGDNLFIETPASGPPQNATPGSAGYGDLLQGNLEQANVEVVSEISDLIAAQRAYEMNAKVISAADQMMQSTAGMFR